jgi:hypothetical protein
VADRPKDPVADAARALAGYMRLLELLVAEPAVTDGPAPGIRSRGAATPEPWHTPAGQVLMDSHEGVRRLEALLRLLAAGHPGRRRGGSLGNTAAAFTAVPKLAAGLDADWIDRAARWLERRVAEAKTVHGIDEARRLRHLPRRAGEALPPRCPHCLCFQLVADLDAKVVFCTVPGCEDGNGLPPVAALATGPDGRPRLEWADGIIETAPDVDHDTNGHEDG